MNNIPILGVTSHKHLGVVFSNNCSWHDNITSIKKAWQRVHIMRSFKFVLDRKSLVEVFYISFIRPVLEYADVVTDRRRRSWKYLIRSGKNHFWWHQTCLYHKPIHRNWIRAIKREAENTSSQCFIKCIILLYQVICQVLYPGMLAIWPLTFFATPIACETCPVVYNFCLNLSCRLLSAHCLHLNNAWTWATNVFRICTIKEILIRVYSTQGSECIAAT